MPSTDDIYGGRFLTAANLDGEVETTIQKVDIEEPSEKQRLVLTLEGLPKPFCVNSTNAARIADLHGKDYTKWPGRKITLTKATTEYSGQTVDCIRVK